MKERYNTKFPTKDKDRRQYAKPTYTRQILGFIARAVAYLQQGGYEDDAAAFRAFCFDVLDSDRAEEAFDISYDVKKDCTRREAYREAVKLLKCAGPLLRSHGEGSWDMFMDEFRAMKAREWKRKEEGLEKTLDDMDDVDAKIDKGDQVTIDAVLELAKEMEEEGGNE